MEKKPNLFHHFKQKNTIKSKQAKKAREEEMLASLYMQSKSKNMTPLSVAGALASSAPHHRKSILIHREQI